VGVRGVVPSVSRMSGLGLSVSRMSAMSGMFSVVPSVLGVLMLRFSGGAVMLGCRGSVLMLRLAGMCRRMVSVLAAFAFDVRGWIRGELVPAALAAEGVLLSVMLHPVLARCRDRHAADRIDLRC
jgi:hypothetical protein